MSVILLDLGLLIAGTALLLLGADWLIDGVGDLAQVLGVSMLVLGVVLAGLEPEEMLTAAIASAQGAPAIAVGDVIGTNITIVTLALGLSALLMPILLSRNVRRQAIIATLVSVVPVVLLFTGSVGRIAGVFLLLLFVGYTLFLLRTDREAIQRVAAFEAEDNDDDNVDGVHKDHSATKRFRWKYVTLTLGGLVAMAIGGPVIVYGARQLVQVTGMTQGVVGATVVSLSTGAEMIALGVTAARKKQADILVGGIIGSFAYNLLVTLGLAAVIRPVPVDVHLLRIALPIMVAVHLVLLALIWYGKMNRLAGALFVLAYVAYVICVVVL